MLHLWKWFDHPKHALTFIRRLTVTVPVSFVMRDPHSPHDVLVGGPLAHAMACYPFLDLPHQLRRFGATPKQTAFYLNLLRHGGVLVMIDVPTSPREIPARHSLTV